MANAVLISLLFLAQQAQQKPLPPILRMDGGKRAIVLACLAGLIILGFLMIALTWLAARWTRRYMGPKLKPTVDGLANDAEWARAQREERDQRR